ncbi:TusE/DsrC/DsvC family sulfur relay protein [Candidatus Portiera aleyrodidarum]|uniref:Sulfurtransferase n=1 Tax=Candidatus Portiera aleyrodidarum TaxID=91844 RepID=A0A8D9JTM4_9GAMM|nr:TusE/DsrC/DsvC family sulfur relay protein [Candidatus Portiera aleyrodidarum]CEI58606.1 Sulfurtransferase TusE [Candidatus Portiera aleyrodidarum]
MKNKKKIILINKKYIELDSEGYLKYVNDWNPYVGHELAYKEGRKLLSSHWEIILLLRKFYYKYKISPTMIPLINEIKQINYKKGNSIYLLKLFTSKTLESPARIAARIAGLPKPKYCI